MSTKSAFREAFGRRGATRAAGRGRSASPMIKLLLEGEDMARPVDVIRLLAEHGLSLKKAHGVLDRLALGERIPVELHVDRPEALIARLHGLGVASRTFTEPHVDVKHLRESQGLTQPEFASLYGLELDTLQNWE